MCKVISTFVIQCNEQIFHYNDNSLAIKHIPYTCFYLLFLLDLRMILLLYGEDIVHLHSYIFSWKAKGVICIQIHVVYIYIYMHYARINMCIMLHIFPFDSVFLSIPFPSPHSNNIYFYRRCAAIKWKNMLRYAAYNLNRIGICSIMSCICLSEYNAPHVKKISYHEKIKH